MFHKGAAAGNPNLYPRIGDTFKTKTNINIKGQGTLEFGVKYIIIGVGYGYPDDSDNRREAWVVHNKYNTEQPEILVWKDQFEKLYDKEYITVIY